MLYFHCISAFKASSFFFTTANSKMQQNSRKTKITYYSTFLNGTCNIAAWIYKEWDPWCFLIFIRKIGKFNVQFLIQHTFKS